VWTTGDIRLEGWAVARRKPGELQAEVRAGLTARPQAMLPAKLLYDAKGCELFDRICQLPEYYPTRTELALLERVAADVATRTGATELVELGSGHARKTHVLLQAIGAGSRRVRYVPFDVDAGVIRASAQRLMQRYPQLSVFGVVGEFDRDLKLIPTGRRRLVAFLGGTIGNFDESEAQAFLSTVADQLQPDDSFLMGADLVKDEWQLHAAYNDSEGVTAAFNLNMLARLEREFGLEIEQDAFVHDAFFSRERSRIEIHARVTRETSVRGRKLHLARHFDAGESIRTEISRKFTRDSLAAMLAAAGMRTEALYVADPPYALALCRRVDNLKSRL
jgi:L-histidine N-alpha-methyltransferase